MTTSINIIANICAEAEGTLSSSRLISAPSAFNAASHLDGTPINVILTDALSFEFYTFDFGTLSVYRGITDMRLGYETSDDYDVTLP